MNANELLMRAKAAPAVFFLLPRPWLEPAARGVEANAVIDPQGEHPLSGEFVHRGSNERIYVKGDLRRAGQLIGSASYWHQVVMHNTR